ncbi:MAG: chalcone isomerase [Halomonadaceae bacterium]|nr:MAG: chalcone isomerase [Halomonadaceae bacterium]
MRPTGVIACWVLVLFPGLPFAQEQLRSQADIVQVENAQGDSMQSQEAAINTRKVSGVRLKERMTAGDQELLLNGAGKRRYFFVDAYVAALYLPRLSQDSQTIINAQEPMAISLHITSDRITRERMVDSIRDGFKQALGGDLEPVQRYLDELLAAFHRKIREGDQVQLIYTPETGVEIRHNGDTVGQVAGDARFKQALFAIWLGDNPVQSGLRRELLQGADF